MNQKNELPPELAVAIGLLKQAPSERIPGEAAQILNLLPGLLGITKSSFARKCGISPSTFTKIRSDPVNGGWFSSKRLLLVSLSHLLETGFWPGEENTENVSNRDTDSTTDSWIVSDARVQYSILNVAQTLVELVQTLQQSNSPGSPQALLNEFQKAALISILESAIKQLQGPVIDKGFLKNIGDSLKKIGKKAVEKEATDAVRDAISGANDSLGELINELPANSTNMTSLF